MIYTPLVSLMTCKNSKEKYWVNELLIDELIHSSVVKFQSSDYLIYWLASWAEQNVDPSLFPKELMAYASSFVEDVEVNN